MSDDIEALPDVWLHNLPHPLHIHRRRHHLPSTAHIPVALSDGFVGPATRGSIRWRDFYPLFAFPPFSSANYVMCSSQRDRMT